MNYNTLLLNEIREEHKRSNQQHTYLLIGGLGFLMLTCAWLLSGLNGVVIAIIASVVFLYFAPRMPGKVVMQMYRAQRLVPKQGQELHYILKTLSQRANLQTLPELYIVPSSTMNAFATGTMQKPYIALTEGLLRRLELPEVAGVIAHEISHIRNNDLKIMALADTMSRVTQLMSFIGIFLIFINIPLFLLGERPFPWAGALLLYLAPTLGNLLQLALSRAREFDADLEGATLTGDPASLASALKKLEHYQGAFWEDIFFPGRRIPQPSLLRSHPPTEERVERLRMITPETKPLAFSKSPMITMVGFGPGLLHPRYHWPWPGIWY